MYDIKYNDNNQPRQYFLDSIIEFRHKIGNKDFWKDEKARDIAVEALTKDYLRTEHGEHLKDDAIMFESALNEYHMREFFIISHGLNNVNK
jgi:hypothetical protein